MDFRCPYKTCIENFQTFEEVNHHTRYAKNFGHRHNLPSLGPNFWCPFQNICDDTFEEFDNVLHHLEIVHKIKPEGKSGLAKTRLRCPVEICEKYKKSTDEILDHIDEEHEQLKMGK